MNTYLAIITTVLVVTQVIRVTQNAIQLRRQVKQLSSRRCDERRPADAEESLHTHR